jgi:transcriptional regulator with XRE-family HTH domain
MDWIPAKLRTIRQEFKMTQLELAQASGLSQRDISQLENGRKEGLPKEYIQFLHTRGVDLNWLFTDPARPEQGPQKPVARIIRNYTTEEDQPSAALVQEDGSVGYGLPKQPAPAQAPAGAAHMSMVASPAQPDYPLRYQEPAFYQTLPVFVLTLPEVQQGVFRGFQVADAAMQPALAPQDWVIARLEEKSVPIEAGTVYVVVTRQQLRVRRLFNQPDKPGILQLKPDAAGFAEAQVPLPDILELWSVKGCLSFRLPATSMVAEQKVTTLEASLKELMDRVQRLEQGQ